MPSLGMWVDTTGLTELTFKATTEARPTTPSITIILLMEILIHIQDGQALTA